MCNHFFESDVSKRQNHKVDCTNFCGLLRKAELYVATVELVLYHATKFYFVEYVM